MTLAHDFASDAAIGVSLTTTPEGLFSIREPECAAAIWHREPLESFQNWIDSQNPEHLPRARMILPADAVRSALSEHVEMSGLPQCWERSLLVDDAAALADIFADVMQASFLRLRLDVVDTNACCKFHVDAVTARLICTYRGTGTQYITPSDAMAPDRIFTTPTSAPLMLRGNLWPTASDTTLLHRSPPIEGTNETRLILVLDPITDLESESARYPKQVRYQ